MSFILLGLPSYYTPTTTNTYYYLPTTTTPAGKMETGGVIGIIHVLLPFSFLRPEDIC